MNNEMTNLLPPERQHALVKNYYIRLGVVIALMISALMLSAAILLLPSYVLLSMNENAEKSRLAAIEATLSSADERDLSVRIATLSRDSEALFALEKASSASATARLILAIAHPGIAISALSYASAADEGSGTLVVSGVAATRDALRKYQIALQNASFVQSADLPVSAYAKDSHISFSINITLKP